MPKVNKKIQKRKDRLLNRIDNKKVQIQKFNEELKNMEANMLNIIKEEELLQDNEMSIVEFEQIKVKLENWWKNYREQLERKTFSGEDMQEDDYGNSHVDQSEICLSGSGVKRYFGDNFNKLKFASVAILYAFDEDEYDFNIKNEAHGKWIKEFGLPNEEIIALLKQCRINLSIESETYIYRNGGDKDFIPLPEYSLNVGYTTTH